MALRSTLPFVLLLGAACGRSADAAPSAPSDGSRMARDARIAFLHHSTGGLVWNAGVPAFIQSWNGAHGTGYRITQVTYPATTGGYPWANYPYDYWTLWVDAAGSTRVLGESNLDDLVAAYDVVVFKHCFPVSAIGPDTGAPSVASSARTLENYRLQYEALKTRLHQYPSKRFLVWTGAALAEAATSPEQATRARAFFDWVKGTWDEPGDNVFVWDFREIETGGGLYLQPGYATSATDSHPNATLSALAAPLVGRRIVDVVEGRGDSGSLTGR
ncbi:MAG TPA: hypothetical protein VLT47_15870 [Anaeromyxobacteraceae bacterium]|nr:hypothetical protein [Anaeromyxobacteraceae bacterium]